MTQLEDLPAVLTIREAAQILRLGRDAAYRAVAAGQIPSLRFGRRLVIPREGLRRLLEGQTTQEQPGTKPGPIVEVCGRVQDRRHAP